MELYIVSHLWWGFLACKWFKPIIDSKILCELFQLAFLCGLFTIKTNIQHNCMGFLFQNSKIIKIYTNILIYNS